jgi:glutamate 5-kinase
MNGDNKQPQCIVVKVGTNTLARPDGTIDNDFISDFVEQLAAVHAGGARIVVVSSGAVRCGAERLGLRIDHLDVTGKQAAAAVGQGLLMERYTRRFARHGVVTAQILLTRDIIDFRQKYLNTRNTFMNLLDRGVVPVVNENDTVAVEEIKFGDNDALGALTAILVEADLLILLSDVSGLYDADPHVNKDAKLICEVAEIDDALRAAAGGAHAAGSTGGMASKLNAAAQSVAAGIRTVIAFGREPDVLKKILAGECVGTTFMPKESSLNSRKKWLAFGVKPEGAVVVNKGARDMIRKGGKSLLPIGVTAVRGEFEAGACVDVLDEKGRLVARGLSNYGAADIEKIKGIHSDKIEQIIGFKISDDVVHRDNMAVL